MQLWPNLKAVDISFAVHPSFSDKWLKAKDLTNQRIALQLVSLKSRLLAKIAEVEVWYLCIKAQVTLEIVIKLWLLI